MAGPKKNAIQLPGLIAHRGYSSAFPENTLRAIEKALQCGACHIECDIQLTRDRVPVLFHDRQLTRITGMAGAIHEMDFTQLQQLSAGFAQRFGDSFTEERIPPLESLVSMLLQWPDRRTFIELKRITITEFGMETVLEKVLPLLEKVRDQVTIISFNREVIEYLANQTDWTTGWVIEEWSEEILEHARNMAIDFLFVDVECLPQNLNQLSNEEWFWVVYEVDNSELAQRLVNMKADFIETNDIKQLLHCAPFMDSGCNQ